MAYLACIITVEVRTPGMDNVHCRKHAMQLFDAVRSCVCVCLVAVEGVNRVVVMYDRQCTSLVHFVRGRDKLLCAFFC